MNIQYTRINENTRQTLDLILLDIVASVTTAVAAAAVVGVVACRFSGANLAACQATVSASYYELACTIYV